MHLPDDFQTVMQQQLNTEFESFKQSLNEIPPTSIRLNARKPAKISGAPIPWTTTGLYLDERPLFTLDPHFHGGQYYVQEASSMFVEQALSQHADLTKSLTVLDLCAAPGGKSTHILNLINEESLLVSNEVIRSRASVLEENLIKWGYPNSIVTNNDPQDFADLRGVFDVILVDAPCSGEGLFRKDPAAMNEWSPSSVELCAARQKRILSDVFPALKSGGLLIYCTCTYNQTENEENLQWLTAHHEVEFLKINSDPAWNVEETSLDNAVGYRFYPHRVKGEGFFISAIRKLEHEDQWNERTKKKINFTEKKKKEAIAHWIANDDRFTKFDHSEITRIFPSNKFHLLEQMTNRLKIVNAGTPVAEFKMAKAIPAHALAVSNCVNRSAFVRVPLDYNQAIGYLRRDAFPLNEISKGYCLVEFDGCSLGFINHLGNRFNNMYPVDWRIRMQTRP